MSGEGGGVVPFSDFIRLAGMNRCLWTNCLAVNREVLPTLVWAWVACGSAGSLSFTV